ncbi:methylamine utilization protein [Candidatus Magnetominusculus xianensis]|uniref:Methylamine utilization protein n=1 Tax=Candidatus Magnetominusculus xianensis TaxID=1748249 RepID=A0ABR5SGW8_9BACT|nr:methylamine utilization protein [Candidatus Magnetominusculus xianensis]KWT90941.1 hypothetical protein ASN18_1025 [Candidatus Magnetominusculus xianensis]MBF0403097.1 methylamine utilization protein [Nitrospirota bacterium]
MKRNIFFIMFIVITMSASATCCYGASLKAFVAGEDGKPVEYAVVTVTPASSSMRDSKAPLQAVVDQVDKEFIDYVTAVQAGTTVTFPNNDKIRHHVYSFSSAKNFEIPLYPPGANTKNKILFDKPGVVVIGCNIHDWMKAYVYVVDTPYFARSDSHGKAVINNLPEGQYEAVVWHPAMGPKSQGQKVKVSVTGSNDSDVKFTVQLTQQWRSRRGPLLEGGGGLYR